MRVAVWEMLENDEVSPIIVIDEAISIVRSISTDTSPSFVNAVLDAIRKDLESPAWSRRQGSEGETSVVDSDHDEAVAESAHDGESLPVQELRCAHYPLVPSLWMVAASKTNSMSCSKNTEPAHRS